MGITVIAPKQDGNARFNSLKVNLTSSVLATRAVLVDDDGNFYASGSFSGGGGGGTGTVTNVSVATANGFAGDVSTPTTTPAIIIKTTVTGLLKGNGTAISSATAGTDYISSTVGTASWAQKSITSSYAETSSLPLRGIITASAVLSTITFTKGDNTTFDITVASDVATSADKVKINNTNTGVWYPTFVTQGENSQSIYVNSASFAYSASINTLYVSTSYAATASVAISSSFAITASYYNETDPVFVAKSASLATTGSNSFVGNQIITGSLIVSGSSSTTLLSTNADTIIITGSAIITGSVVVTGSVNATSFTGSLFGTSSWADTASVSVSSSFSTTASYAISSSVAVSASYADTASIATSASFSATASLPLRGIITASAAVSTITFTKGDGTEFAITLASDVATSANTVKINNTNTNIWYPTFAISGSGTQSLYVNSASFSYDASINTLYVSTSYSISSSNSLSASYAITASNSDSSSYAISSSNSISSSNAISASYAPNAGGGTNYIPLWTSATALSSSVIYQTGGNIGISKTDPTFKLDINSSGSLRSASGSQLLSQRIQGSTENNDYLEITNTRVVDGPDWQSAGFRLQQKVDNTFMGYLQFNGGNNYGVSLGSGFSTISGSFVSESLRIDNSGYVGIGTKTPQTILDVKGRLSFTSASVSNIFAERNGNYHIIYSPTSNPGIYIGNAIDNGNYYDNGSHQFRSAGGGTYYAVITTAGNVGINTTSPAAKLDVNGAAVAKFFGGSGSVPAFGQIETYMSGGNPTYGNNYAYYSLHRGGESAFQLGMTGSTFVIAQGGGGGQFNLFDNKYFAINANGNVGIGTTDPQQKLHVEGSATIGTTGTEDILILGRALSGGVSFQQAASLKLGRYQNAGGGFESYTRLDIALRDNSAASNYNTNTTVMTLTNAGNVGINTTSPDAKLQIGDSRSDTGTQVVRIIADEGAANTVVDAIHIDHVGSDYNQGVAISFGVKSTTYGTYASRIVNYTDTGVTQATKLQLQTQAVGGTTWNTGILIDDIGNVGIGTVTPSSLLTVAGNISSSAAVYFKGLTTTNQSNVVTIDTATGQLYYTASSAFSGSSLIGGSTNYVARWASATTLTTGSIFDDGTNVGIGTASPSTKLHIIGSASIAVDGSGQDTSPYAPLGVTRAATAANLAYIGMTKTATIPWGIGISSNNFLIVGAVTANTQVIAAPIMTWDYVNKNVGIGTTTPLQALSVVGNVSASSYIKSGGTSTQFLKADGTVDGNTYITGNQNITLTGDVTGTGATSIATTIGAGKVTNAMLVNSSLYIGTTSISLGRASAAQTLTGVSIDGTAGGENLATVTNRNGVTSNAVQLTSVNNYFSGHHYFVAYDASGNHYPHYNAGTDGTGAIVNTRVYGAGEAIKVFLLNGKTGAITWDGYTIFHSGNLSSFVQGGNSFGTAATLGTNDAQNLILETNGSTRVTVTSAGDVGIGTTDPQQKLHVEGSATIGTTGTEDILILGRALSGGVSFQQAASLKLGRYQNAGGGFESYTRLDIALRDNSAASNYNTNTTVMTLTNAGNVGINTTSPDAKLQIGDSRSDTGTQVVRIIADEGAANTVVDAIHIDHVGSDYNQGVAISFGVKSTTYGTYASRIVNYTDTGVTQATKLQLQTQAVGGTTWNTGILIDDIGNVGINTTDPSSSLHVNNTNSNGVVIGTVPGNVGTLQLVGGVSSSPVSSRLMFGTDGTGWQFRIAKNQASTITDLVTVLDSGKVGIGNITPEARFEIKSFAANNLGGLMVRANATTNYPVLLYENSSNGGVLDLHNSANTLTTKISSNENSYFNGGNLGIGTTNPAFYKLQVNGNAYISSSLTVTDSVSVGWPDKALGNSATLDILGTNSSEVSSSNGGVNMRILNYNTASAELSAGIRLSTSAYNSGATSWIVSRQIAAGSTELHFYTSNNSVINNPRLIIKRDGKVGIGTNFPAYQLELSTDSAAKPSTNTWTISSDSRIKTNIQSYTKGLEVIKKINPVSYDYNGKAGFDPTKGGIGIIAQDIKDILPESISSYHKKLNPEDENETELYNFNSHALTYVLINAVKEQQKQIENLQTQINKLKNGN